MALFGFGNKNQRRVSEKNGIIDVQHGVRGPNVIVEGYSQTGAGLNAIWRDALRRAEPLLPEAPKVLVIGLGGGGIVGVLYELFAEATITALEHDPEMIAITRELKYYEPHPEPRIIEGDALEMLGELDSNYDLIAIDIFRGGTPSALLQNDAFWHAIKQVLAPAGIVQVNVAGKRWFLDAPAQHFSHADLWKCAENYLGMFRI